MEQFDIIGQLKTEAEAKGWKFVYSTDKFYRNIMAQQEYADGELVLVADFKVQPTYAGVKYSNLKYTCLLMLGSKFDADGLSATLDEDSQQKYDRRLKMLVSSLAGFIGEFKCNNELDVSPFTIEIGVNVFDTNLDFAITNATFDQ